MLTNQTSYKWTDKWTLPIERGTQPHVPTTFKAKLLTAKTAQKLPKNCSWNVHNQAAVLLYVGPIDGVGHKKSIHLNSLIYLFLDTTAYAKTQSNGHSIVKRLQRDGSWFPAFISHLSVTRCCHQHTWEYSQFPVPLANLWSFDSYIKIVIYLV